MAVPADPNAAVPVDLKLDPNAPTVMTSAATISVATQTISATGRATTAPAPASVNEVQFADVPLAEVPLADVQAAPVAPKAPPAPAASKKPAGTKKAVSWQLGAVVAAVLVIAGVAVTLSWPRADAVQPVTPPVVPKVAPGVAPPAAAAPKVPAATATVALAGAAPSVSAAVAPSARPAPAPPASGPAALPTVAAASRAAAPVTTPPPSAASAAAASPAALARPKWVQTPQPKWTTDKYKTITFELEAENDVAVWMKRVRPTLAVRCLSRQTEVFVVTDTAASFEPTADRHTVRLGFDAAAPTTELWSDSADHRELFAPDGADLAQRIANANRLQFVFTPFNASPVKAEFDVRGFAGPLQSIGKMCGSPSKRAANDRPVKVADAR